MEGEDRQVVPQRVLVIRFSSIGDIVLASPLLRALARTFPSADIDFATKEEFADLVRFSPYVHEVLVLPKGGKWRELERLRQEVKARRYDVIVDIHKNFRSFYVRLGAGPGKVLRYRKWRWARTLLIVAKKNVYPGVVPVYQRYLAAVGVLGVKGDGRGPEVFLDPGARQRVQNRLEQVGFMTHPLRVAIVPGAGFCTKRWLPERFAEVADSLAERHQSGALILGDAGDRAIAQEVASHMQTPHLNLAGALSLMESAAALDCCDLVLCNDTGLMHIAAALGKCVVAIFGPTTEELGFFPFGGLTRVVQKDLPCRPCSAMGSTRCPKRHFRCMRDISAQEVVAAAEELLSKRGKEFCERRARN
ncbi:MAG: lipopolysaccharide heptosyltransferase II [candidate division KSB1 bacterium]|nr:lipopolysaccharide heptosyltransferase II [candidate division KSB1 bacterium]